MSGLVWESVENLVCKAEFGRSICCASLLVYVNLTIGTEGGARDFLFSPEEALSSCVSPRGAVCPLLPR